MDEPRLRDAATICIRQYFAKITTHLTIMPRPVLGRYVYGVYHSKNIKIAIIVYAN